MFYGLVLRLVLGKVMRCDLYASLLVPVLFCTFFYYGSFSSLLVIPSGRLELWRFQVCRQKLIYAIFLMGNRFLLGSYEVHQAVLTCSSAQDSQEIVQIYNAIEATVGQRYFCGTKKLFTVCCFIHYAGLEVLFVW